MFGLIRAYKPEMKFKEYETYKALYCTLCKKLGDEYGFLARMSLSYDSVFMIMLAMSAQGEFPCYVKKKCCCNPFKKCNYCKTSDPVFDYCAAVLVLLTAAKLTDNKQDSKGIKKLFWKTALLCYSKGFKKATDKYPKAADDIKNYLAEQTAVETNEFKGLDSCAEPTASVMKKLFSYLSDDPKTIRIFGEIGYCLGKWVYVLDAVDDIKQDQKSGNFNPILLLKTDSSVKEKTEPLLNSCAVRIAEDMQLLDIVKYKTILENIVYFGLKEVQKIVYEEKKK